MWLTASGKPGKEGRNQIVEDHVAYVNVLETFSWKSSTDFNQEEGMARFSF